MPTDHLSKERLPSTGRGSSTRRRDLLSRRRNLLIDAASAAICAPRGSRCCWCRLWSFPRLQMVELVRPIRRFFGRARSRGGGRKRCNGSFGIVSGGSSWFPRPRADCCRYRGRAATGRPLEPLRQHLYFIRHVRGRSSRCHGRRRAGGGSGSGFGRRSHDSVGRGLALAGCSHVGRRRGVVLGRGIGRRVVVLGLGVEGIVGMLLLTVELGYPAGDVGVIGHVVPSFNAKSRQASVVGRGGPISLRPCVKQFKCTVVERPGWQNKSLAVSGGGLSRMPCVGEWRGGKPERRRGDG